MVIIVFIRNYLLFASLVFILFLSGCSTSDRGCRAGDNFGNNSTEFDSYRESSSPDYRDNNNILIDTKKGGIKWQNTGLSTNGESIVIEILGHWTPWGANSMKEEKIVVIDGKTTTALEFIKDEKICNGFPEQDIASASEVIPNVRYITFSKPAKNAGGYPCWITNGISLYLLFRNPKDPDPNSSVTTIQNPISGTIHLNRKSKPNDSRFEIEASTDELKDSNGISKSLKQGMEIYGKINDSYYPDNDGTYQLHFINGVYKAKKTPAFEGAYNFIVKPVQDASKKIFLSIVTQEAYKRAIYALLTLYIVCTGLLYLMGAIQSQLGELTLRLLKIGFILVLLTPNAWNFFYDHIFKLYTEGLPEIINIIVSGDRYNPENPLDFMDRITEKILTPNLAPRMTAIYNANGVIGCAYLIFLSLIILFFAICVIFSFASYIIGMILLAIMTSMFPIFLTMILFNFTRQIFNDYLDSILGYSFQIIICFTTLFFMSRVIENNIERTLGFRICVAPIISFNPFSTIDPEELDLYTENKDGTVKKSESDKLVFKNWVPGEAGLYKTFSAWSMFIPGYNFKSIYDLMLGKKYGFKYDIQKMLVPPEYERTRYRYTALPFLEPDERMADTDNLSSNAYISCMTYATKEACDPDKVFPGADAQNDHIRIKSIMFTDHSRKFVDFGDLFIILLFMFILWELNINFIPTISKWIALSGKGYVMPATALGNSIIMSYNQYMRAVQKLSENKGPIKYLGMALSLATTTQGFFWQKIAATGIGKLEDKVSSLGGKVFRRITMIDSFTTKIDEMGDRVDRVKGNRVTNFASELGSSMLDSVLYQDSITRSIARQAEDKDQEEKNLRGINKARDLLGGTIDRFNDGMKNEQKAMLYQGLKGMHVSPINRMIIGDRGLDFSWKDGKHYKDEIPEKKNLFKEDTEKFRERFGGERNSADFESKVYWEAILRKYNNDVEIDTRGSSSSQTTSTPTTATPAHHTPATPPSPPPSPGPGPAPSAPPPPISIVSSTTPSSATDSSRELSASSTIPVSTVPLASTSATSTAPAHTTTTIPTTDPVIPSTTTTVVIEPTPPPVFVLPVEQPTTPQSSATTTLQPISSSSASSSQSSSLGGPFDTSPSSPFFTPPSSLLGTPPYDTPPTNSPQFQWPTQPSQELSAPSPVSLPQSAFEQPPTNLAPTPSQQEQSTLATDQRSDFSNFTANENKLGANNLNSTSPEATQSLDQSETVKNNELKQDLTESRTVDPKVQEQIDLLTKEIRDKKEELDLFRNNTLLAKHLENELMELRKRLELIQK